MQRHKETPLRRSHVTVIIGCGALGASIANMLSGSGYSVVVIDADRDSFGNLSSTFAGITITGDATNLAILEEANLRSAAALVAVTGRDNTNIMVAETARELFGVEKVIARLFDPERENVYREFGIETFSPVILGTKHIGQMLRIKDDLYEIEKTEDIGL